MFKKMVKTRNTNSWLQKKIAKYIYLWRKIKFTDIDECEGNPCENGASCTDDAIGYTCWCVDVYTGVNCETGMV